MARISFHLSTGNCSTGATCWMPAFIDHDIDASEGAFGIAHHRFDLPDVAQVGVVIAGDLAQRGDFSPGVAAVAEAIEHQLGACLRQHFGDP